MKKVFIICWLSLLLWNFGNSQNCFGDVTFYSQESIDEFFINNPNCTGITGDVIIEQSFFDTISDLSPLIQLKTIGGDLLIDENYYLQSLSGLDSISDIGGGIRIYRNDALTNTNGLGGVSNMGGGLVIFSNASLQNITDFGNLDSIPGNITISYNENILGMSGLSTLEFVGGTIDISTNNSLPDLTGLNGLTTVGGDLKVFDNQILVNLSGLENLHTIGNQLYLTTTSNSVLQNITALANLTNVRDIRITGNPLLENLLGLENVSALDGSMLLSGNGLTSLSGLENLSIINENLTIHSNNTTNFTGLESLISIGDSIHARALTMAGLNITGNGSLESLSGIDNLESLGGVLNINQNLVLENITALSNLTYIKGDISNETGIIIKKTLLQNFEGLHNLDSIGGGLFLEQNYELLNLDAFAQLSKINGYIKVYTHPLITDISPLSNIDYSTVNQIQFFSNTQLAYCHEPFICDYLDAGEDADFWLNAPGCESENDVLLACISVVDHTDLVGSVFHDIDTDCIETPGDSLLENWLLEVSNNTISYTVSTNNLGEYSLPVLEGDWELNVVPPSSFWVSCFTDTLLQATAMNDSILTDFYVSTLGDCPYLEWNIGVNRFRVCDSNYIYIPYCNYGTQAAVDAVFSVTLDPFLTFMDATHPYTIATDGSLTFEMDTINPLDCGHIRITTFADCDSLMIGDYPCVDVTLMSDELCAPDPLWDGSIITVDGFCENDSIYFELENIGSGGMAAPAQFRVEIVIDDIILMLNVDDYQLPAGFSETLSYEKQGQGLRLAADQTPGHPVYSEASIIVPNCDSAANDSILTLLPSNDGDPFSESHCAPAVNSYDPNIKTTIPQGLGDNHEIDKGWELNYTVQFQNTGNDVAYLVVIKDTLSENLDLSTLRVQGASHPFTWMLNPDRELVFTFENILLPDSTSNEPESHGYVQYCISSKAEILPGEIIENRAGIYFDSNDPIITNITLHTIKKPIITSSEQLNWCAGEAFQGQTIWQDTSLQFLTSFTEYDSIHFIHLSVLPQITNTAYAEVVIGEYFEDVLIENDTNFVVTYTGQNGCDSLVTFTIGALTDIDRIGDSFSQIEIYPNPVSEYLHVLHHQNGLAQHWTLHNHLGQQVWSKFLVKNESLNGISFQRFSSGVYWLEVKTDQGRWTWRVIHLTDK